MINSLSLQGITTRMADFLLQRQNIDDTCRATRKRGGYPAPILTTYAICADSGVAWRARTRAGATPDRNHHLNTYLDSPQLAGVWKRYATLDRRNSNSAWFSRLFRLIPFCHPYLARTVCVAANRRGDGGCRYYYSGVVSYRPYWGSLVRCFPMGHTG
jgi:hypothetical protein